MSDPRGRGLPKGHAANWGAAFLPGVFQGTHLHSKGAPIDNLERAAEMSDASNSAADLLVRALEPDPSREACRRERAVGADRELRAGLPDAKSAAPEAIASIPSLRISSTLRLRRPALRPRCTRNAWSPGAWSSAVFALSRSIPAAWTISSPGMDTTISREITNSSPERPTSRWPACSPISNQRGLFEDTLVIWGGEFGRLPIAQKTEKPGRDHNPNAFTFWLAGGGVKGGVSHGETDEIGYHAVVDRMHVNDLHATILRLLGPRP